MESAKRGEIGRRIRAIRRERSLTLRQVASRARLSATHISEIERGHTTPTVGALVRIAAALGREPHFFLESEALSDVSIVRRGEPARLRRHPAFPECAEPLSRGIPGGRLTCARLLLDGREARVTCPPEGELAGYVLRGRVILCLGDEELELTAGDGFHLSPDLPHTLRNADHENAEVLCVTTYLAQLAR